MSTVRDHGANVVRPLVPWKAHKAFYVFVFLVTGVLVYQWGWLKADRQPAADEYTATATVCHQVAGRPFQADKDGLARPSYKSVPDDLRQQILSAASLDRAIRQLDARINPRDGETRETAIQRAIEEARRSLSVEVTEKSASSELQVAITATDAQPQHALLLVNTLAEHYAADFRTHWKSAAQDAYLAARDAAQRAQRDFLDAKTRLEACEKDLARLAAKPAEEPKPAPVAEPKQVEDPQWTEISAQLTRLQQRRSALLIDRTPAHPAVQEVELRIAEAQRLLDATPRWIAAPQMPTPAVKQPAVVERKPDPAATPAETVRQLQELRDAVTRASQAGETAAAAERRARQAFEHEPRIDVQLAQACSEATTEGERPGIGLLFASLFVGLTAAAGVCLVGAGISLEPAVANLGELESLLGAPVLGVIPCEASGSDSADSCRRQQFTRWGLIGGGAVVLFLCILLARWTLGG